LLGMYFESEGGRNGDPGVIGRWQEATVFKEHPEWFYAPPEKAPILNLSIPEAAEYLEAELRRIIEFYGLDLYRHDFNAETYGQSCETLRDGFVECDYWRHYEALYGILTRVRARYPDVILQQAAAGGERTELSMAGQFHEHFTSDNATMPDTFRILSGLSVVLPPEILVNANGMAEPYELPDLLTTLRGAYTLGNTPMIFNGLLPRSVEEFKAEDKDLFLRYANLYKSFIRPLISTCKVWHHAPISGGSGVESGEWFAMEFTSPDQTRGWATIVRLAKRGAGSYPFTPRGLNPQMKYKVTFDNTGRTQTMDGRALTTDGLSIRPEPGWHSEFLLFEGC
jgi:alpha-galactosidase